MLKVKHLNEIHIFRINVKSCTIQQVQELVRNNFKQHPFCFGFCYVDGEGDQIEVSTDEDLQAIIQLEQSELQSKQRLMIKLILKEQVIEQPEILAQEEEVQDDHNQFQILTQSSSSEYQQLNSSQMDYQSVVLQVEQEENEFSQKNIAEIAKANVEKIQRICIENALKEMEDKLIKSQVESYLGQMYNSVQEQEQRQLKRLELQQKRHEQLKKARKDKKEKELTTMIENSLKKLLPDFMKRLSEKTIDSVKEILASETQTY